MLKSVCRVWFVTYRGAFGMVLRILDWDLHDDYIGLAGATSIFWATYLFFHPEEGRTFPLKFSYISQKYHGVMTQMTIIFTRYRQITSNLTNFYNEINSLWRPRCYAHCLSYPPVFWLVGSCPSGTVASHPFHCCIAVNSRVSGDLL